MRLARASRSTPGWRAGTLFAWAVSGPSGVRVPGSSELGIASPPTDARSGPTAPARPGVTLPAQPRATRRARWPSANSPSHFAVAACALVVATLLTRLPFMTQRLYAFDSANYALAVSTFYNVAFHQPHPPGYPLYVFFARAIDMLVHDANRALVLEGILWSTLATACTIGLGRALFGRAAGLLSGLLLVTTVGFWGYGEVAYPYVALAGETATLALLAHAVITGHGRLIVLLGLAWGISAGVRWDAAVFCLPLWLWALWCVGWRLRLASVGLAAAVVAGWAVPMIVLSGGWDVYRQALATYLQVWSPQSAYVVGDFASGGDTQANYNLSFLINYLRQMLGVGLVLVLYLVGRRFGPGRLAADYRSRFLGVWVVPPISVYIFAHLGEPGYVLSLAPAASILIALAIGDLREEMAQLTRLLRARGWRWLPPARLASLGTAGLLGAAIVGWNVQAFARGVGPGRLPDLRAHDATTGAQVEFVRQQPPETTVVLAHDIYRQLRFYAPAYRSELLFSEYVPDFQTARTRTELAAGTQQLVVLDSLLQVGPDDAGRVREVVLRDQPRVSVWVVDARGAAAVEHGYRYLRLVP
ncbi:MAG: glycosyltransferase family 39 protein [Chloroflexota bacterium]|nr:glycosyltransferase family 39 protein [Chloroflexota bacterium]